MTKHLHFLGICGMGMGSLAGLCHAAGHRVTGSDENIYPPMSTQLAALGISVLPGYRPEHLAPRPDLVVIGNVITKANPEARAAIAAEIQYRSMPDALAELFFAGREPLVIAGTHGKTTASALAAWLLEAAGLQPGFLIGGVPIDFGVSYRIGTGRAFVVEGDEYDTAFFDKTPKLWHYGARAAILGPIEFDHADIYRDLAHVRSAFAEFIRRLPADGLLAACADNENVRAVIEHAPCRVVTYGLAAEADYAATAIRPGPDGVAWVLRRGDERIPFRSPLPGRHNVQNCCGVIALLAERGAPLARLQDGLARFAGVKRRQEVRGTAGGITVIDDFAHHPTAVRETLAALRAHYADRRLFVAFEPRSNTTKRKVFQREFAEAFPGAAGVCIAAVHRAETIPAADRLNPEQLAADLRARGANAAYCPDTETIITTLLSQVRAGDVIVCMSNGGFDDIHEQLLQRLRAPR
ncbi:MAG: hypothetical protein HY543_10765 [Deltaproteobacteria bacterium]|nr:hypothetical protein [Deltaproteobacteria bacterium]